MVTAIYSFVKLGGFLGLFPWTLFWIMSVVLYFVIFSMIKVNRVKGSKGIIFSFIRVEIIFDILWVILYNFNHWYLEYGVGITFGFFTWCFMLLVGGVFLTVKNMKMNAKE